MTISSNTGDGVINLNNGTLNIATGNTITINNRLTWRSGVIDGGGVLAIASGAGLDLVTGADHIVDNATTIDNRGTARITAGTLQLNNGSVFDNNGLFDFVGDITVNSTVGGGVFNLNSGAGISKTGGNGSTIFSDSLTLNIIDASLDAQIGDIRLQGTSNINGTLSSNTGSSIIFDGTVNLADGSILSGGYQLQGGTLNIVSGDTATVSDQLVWNGAATITGGGTLQIASTAQFDLDAAAASHIVDNTTINNQGVTRFIAGSFQLDNNSTFNNSGLFEFKDNNTISSNGGGAFNNNGGTLRTSHNGLATINTGIYTHTAATIDIRSGSLDLNAPLGLDAGSVLEGGGTFIGNVNNTAGTVRPGGDGNTAALTITGDYTQGPAGRLAIEIADSSNFDVLQLSGTADLAGDLTVSEINGFDATASASYDFITAGAITGSLDGKNIFPVGYERAFITGNSYRIIDRVNNTVFFDNYTGDLDWNTADNWSTGQLPVAVYDVDTTAVTGSPIIISGGTHTINSLTTASNITNTGGSLTVTGDVIVPDNFVYKQSNDAAFTQFDGNVNSTSSQAVTMVNDRGELLINGNATADIENNAFLGGTGTVNGNVLNNGVFSPGDAAAKTALFTINGDLVLTADSIINVDTAGLNQGAEYDAVSVSGNITFNGDLNILVDGSSGYVASVGDTFEVFLFTASSGGITVHSEPGYTHNIELLPNRLNLVATAVPGRFLRDTQNDIVILIDMTRDIFGRVFTLETEPEDSSDEADKTLVCT